MGDLLTVQEAARVIGLSAVRVRALCGKEIAATKLGRDWIIERAEAERFAKLIRPGPGRPPVSRGK